MGATLVVGVSLVAGVVNLSVRKHVNLVVDGRQETVATTSGLQDLLLEEGITLLGDPGAAVADERDRRRHDRGGAPAIASGAEAFLASDAALFESPTDVGVWVMAGTGRTPPRRRTDSSRATSPLRAGSSPVVPVQVVVLGKVRDVLTNAGTAGELLSAMGINPTLTTASCHRPAPPPRRLDGELQTRCAS